MTHANDNNLDDIEIDILLNQFKAARALKRAEDIAERMKETRHDH